MDERVKEYLKSPAFGVVGASADRSKFGNMVLRCYQQHGMTVFAVNPTAREVEGTICYASVADLPEEVKSISIITPPRVTERVVEEALAKGITGIWMQPGAESPKAVAACREKGVNVIADGTCILVALGFAH